MLKWLKSLFKNKHKQPRDKDQERWDMYKMCP